MALTNWLKAALSFDPESGKKNKKSKAALAADQRDLAVKLKDSFSVLENELAGISGLIQSAKDGDEHAAEKIRSRQAHLRNLMARVRAGFMRTADLDRESSEWRSLLNSGDADPAQLAKLEILTSELELRAARPLRPESPASPTPFCNIRGDAPVATSLQDAICEPQTMDVEGAEDEQDDSCVVLELDQASHDDESANHLDMVPETLLAGIKHTSNELAKYQEFQAYDDDFLHTIHELRDLHAALKVLDRKNGYCRDRIAATEGFERIF